MRVHDHPFRPAPRRLAVAALGPPVPAAERRDLSERALLATLTFSLVALLLRFPGAGPTPRPAAPVDPGPAWLVSPALPDRVPPGPPPPPALRRVPLPAPPTPTTAPVPEEHAAPTPTVLRPAAVRRGPPHAPPARAGTARPVRVGLAGLEPPVALHEPEPRYPRVALGIHLGGTVALRVVVSEHGEVVEVDVLHEPSPGYGFAEAALAAVRARRYRPARLEGRPVACELVVRVHFRPRP